MASVRGKRPAIGWGGTLVPVPVDADPVDYANTAALFAVWDDTFATGYSFTIAPEAAYSGSVGIKLDLGSSGTDTDTYIRRSFSGLTAGALHRVRCRTFLNYDMGDDAHWVGIRLGTGALDYVSYTAIGAWRQLSVQGVADGAGALEVQLGAFNSDFVGGPRWAYFDDVTVDELVAGGSGLLRFGYPADSALAAPVLRPRTRRFSDGSGTERGQRTAFVDRLQLEARWIPRLDGLTVEGHQASGWEGATGWEQFLAHAWAGGTFTYHPDQENLGLGYLCTLEQPRPFGGAGEPPYQLEADGTRRISLTLRCLSGPFLGY